MNQENEDGIDLNLATRKSQVIFPGEIVWGDMDLVLKKRKLTSREKRSMIKEIRENCRAGKGRWI